MTIKTNKQLHLELLERIEMMEKKLLKHYEVEKKVDSSIVEACKIPVKGKFMRNGDPAIYMRVKPTSYLLNSSVVTDSINEGKPLVVNLLSGTCYFIRGNELVTKVIGD